MGRRWMARAINGLALGLALVGLVGCGGGGGTTLPQVDDYTPANAWGTPSKPVAVDVGPDGTVYVALLDFYQPGVAAYSAEGQFIRRWGTNGYDDGQFDNPMDLAVDGDGHVFVVDYRENRVQKFSADGRFLLTWGLPGTEDGEFIYPQRIAVDDAGDVYVLDEGALPETDSHRIQRFHADGTFVASWRVPNPAKRSTVSDVLGIAAANHRVYVCNTYAHALYVYSDTGALQAQWTTPETGDPDLTAPGTVAVDRTTGHLFVTDTEHRCVQQLTADGTFVRRFGAPADGASPYTSTCTDVAVAGDGTVYVCDRDNNRIRRFDPVLR